MFLTEGRHLSSQGAWGGHLAPSECLQNPLLVKCRCVKSISATTAAFNSLERLMSLAILGFVDLESAAACKRRTDGQTAVAVRDAVS